MKPSILLYYRDLGEKAALERIRIEFQNRGFKADFERNLQEHADIGVYACGSNNLYDFQKQEWNNPNNQLSVFMLHDLYQDNGLGADYFLADPLHLFDLALFPSKV
jgi:hypothetical protein